MTAQTYKKINSEFYNSFLYFSSSKIGARILSLWAFLETSFWFVAPDFLLFPMSLHNPKKYKKLFLITLSSAILGTSFYFFLNTLFIDLLTPVLNSTPFVTSNMINFVQSTYSNYGYLGLLYQSFSFISLKVWINLAVKDNFNFLIFIFLTTISRSIRFFAVALIGKLAGTKLKKFVRNNSLAISIAYALIFFMMLYLIEARF